MAEIKNIQQLPEFVRNDVHRYVEQIISIHQDNILSISVYGSAASGNYVPTVSDINLMVVVKKLDFEVLKSSLHLVKQGQKKKITAPLFLTREYMARSLDVFPIEFLDMKEQHILLYGQDILGELVIDGSNLRIFCEQQLKGKLLRIRQAYLECGLAADTKERLLHDSVKALIPIFGNLLRLRGKNFSGSRIAIFKSLGEEFKLDLSSLEKINQSRMNHQKMTSEQVDGLFIELIAKLEQLIDLVDT